MNTILQTKERMKIPKRISLILLILVNGSLVFGQLSISNIFTDHMVLQRNQALVFWGSASPNESVKLKIGTSEMITTADLNGKWMATINGLATGGPYTLLVQGVENELTIKDILVGDVWLCSGQSNMEWPLKNTDRANIDIPKGNFAQIRHLEVKKDLSFSPKDEILPTEWKVASPENIGDFTAVGYYFAKYLNTELGVPIGLVHSSWGGSHVETWTSQKAMAASKVLGYYANKMPKTLEESAKKMERATLTKLYNDPNTDPSKIDETAYLKKDYDFSKWLKIGPGQWDWQGFAGYRGQAYLHQKVELDESFIHQITDYKFGSTSGEFTLYINGELIAKGIYANDIELKIPKNSWVKGTNHILTIVSQNANGGSMGVYGSMDAFYVSNESKKVFLADEKWDMIPRWNDQRHYANLMNNEGSLCYNAMIAPITHFAIKGAIWYQGESNASRAYQYRESFPLMIENWRKDWGYDFPFYFVQLSSYGASQNSNEGSNWAELREAQTMTLTLPNTGMAVTTDIGNPIDIHPRNKLDVGERLAKVALEGTYGKEIVGNGPMFKSMTVKQERAIISFSHVGSGLMVKDKYGYLQGFEIAGVDQKFYYAQAAIEGNQVVVSHPMVSKPAAVRFAWTNAPEDANLFNKEGLPASPFRTDKWKGVTEGEIFE